MGLCVTLEWYADITSGTLATTKKKGKKKGLSSFEKQVAFFPLSGWFRLLGSTSEGLVIQSRINPFKT